ncbi:MAG: alpha-galactosidase [Lachnospiraceae bacterium]|nr:alpha-galactosidase [Lachnospiraceae bacterium]
MSFEEEVKELIAKGPGEIKDSNWRYDAFENGKVLLGKKKGHLPAMGWNSWNAFGSGNTEALTKAMAEKLVELGLDQLGYKYVVLDDGCYQPYRNEGKIMNEPVKFPSGFRALADFLHAKGLKFGMYNDIGTNLCAGAAVGTCSHEKTDAASYVEWGVDFLKVDNCYYLWDNATFSDAANARYVFAPNLRGISLKGEGIAVTKDAVSDGILTGNRGEKKETYVTGIGSFDGTGPASSPVSKKSSELCFEIDAPKDGVYELVVCYATGKEEGVGAWLQVLVENGGEADHEKAVLAHDGFLPETEGPESFADSAPIKVTLKAGRNVIRLANHRRQENTLNSYAAMLEGLNLADPGHDVILSICEWGKTYPHDWGYKVGDSWRILNDITFCVGADGDPGKAAWTSDYTTGVTAQYNKAVIQDEYAGLDRGWNDPDMMMIGMNGLTEVMCKTHMTMWCMMNSPLMLGMDLRRMEKGDALYNIVSNTELIALNQDALGVQAKRIFASKISEEVDGVKLAPDKAYERDNDRVDILAKPLSDGSVALSFINLSQARKDETYAVSVEEILGFIGKKMVNAAAFEGAKSYAVKDLWTGETSVNETRTFAVNGLEGCDNVTIRVTPNA